MWAFLSLVILATSATPQPRLTYSPLTEDKPPVEGMQLPTNAVSEIENTISEKLDSKYERMLNDAKSGDDRIREQLSIMLDGIMYGLAVLGTIISVLVIWGFVEIKNVRKVRESAEELTLNIDKHIISQVRTAVEKDWGVLETLLNELPHISDEAKLANTPPSKVPSELALAYEEADSLIVLGDKLNAIGNPEKASSYFVKLARYWWVSESWPRATARSKRAIEINPTSPHAHWEYGIGLLNRVGREKEAAIKLPLLIEAESYIHAAKRLKIDDESKVFNKLGWIYDERRDYTSAIYYYGKALESATLSQSKRAKYGYNLACSLAKTGSLKESLRVLEPIMALEDNWRLAESDPDFESLRQTEDTRGLFQELIQRGRKTATGS